MLELMMRSYDKIDKYVCRSTYSAVLEGGGDGVLASGFESNIS